MKAVAVAGLLIVAGFVGVLVFIVPDAPSTDGMAATAVAANSANGRLLFGVDDVALGSTAQDGGAETTRWSGLHRAEGRADLVPDTIVSLASGEISIDPINEARFTFRSAAYVKNGILHELIIPQDTLRLRIPGEPGHPGDTLLVTFDVARSIADEGGLLIFRPYVSEARWIHPPTTIEMALLEAEAGNLSSMPVVPQAQSYESPAGTQGPGSLNQQAQVGRLSVYVRDAPEVAVSSLVASFHKVGLETTTGSIGTYFEGAKAIDLRQYAGPSDRAHLVTFQLPAGGYSKLHLQFDAANGNIALKDESLTIPQPHLGIERPFSITAGQTVEVLIDFSIPESVNPAGEGWEFRPVAAQFQVSDTDNDEDGLVDPRDPDDDDDGIPDHEDADRDGDGVPDLKPSQYRTGGNPMPSLGQTNSYYVQSATGRDPDQTTENAGEAATGGESRPIGSGGVDDDALARIGDPEDVLKEPGVPMHTANGERLYILQSLSHALLPSAQTLAPLGAVEVARLENLPVMLVAGPAGLGADLRALPGVIHVEEDVATAPFP